MQYFVWGAAVAFATVAEPFGSSLRDSVLERLVKVPYCDSLRIGEPNDFFTFEKDPILDSDTLTRVPPLKVAHRELFIDEEQVFQFYVGKRGKWIRHGKYQRVKKGSDSGKIVESGQNFHNKPVGRWITFHSSGQIQSEQEYQGGKLHGKMTTYYLNGVVYAQKEFDHGRDNCTDGESVGYHENGRLKYRTRLRDGYLVEDAWFDTSGNLLPMKNREAGAE